jgi:hypothetical protein
MEKAILYRRLDHFGVALAWYGEDRIHVLDSRSGELIDVYPANGSGVRSASEAMREAEDQMHSDCVAFC